MSEQTARGAAQSAENRAKAQQREQIRAVLRQDAELRTELVAELRTEMAGIAAQAVTDTMSWQARERTPSAPPAGMHYMSQVSAPFSRDPDHDPEVVRALAAGASLRQLNEIMARKRAEQRAGQRPAPDHDPEVVRALAAGVPIGQVNEVIARKRPAQPDDLWPAPVFCGAPLEGGMLCRPTSPCGECSCKRQQVTSGNAGQRSHTQVRSEVDG